MKNFKNVIVTIILSSIPIVCYPQYVPWNANPDRERENIEAWAWSATDAYNKHFYDYCLSCLKSLDSCNKSRRHTHFSESLNQNILNLTDSIQSRIIGTFNSSFSDIPQPIYVEKTDLGSNVIFPGDKRISYRNIQSLIETNNKAIELYRTLISDEGIEFHPQLSNNKNKIKPLDLSFKFQHGGLGCTQWGCEEETCYYFNYNIPTNTKTIRISAFGYFTDEQLTQINQILQQVLDSAF